MTIKPKDLKYEENKYTYGFQQIKTIRSFSESTDTDKINIYETDKIQNKLLENMAKFNNNQDLDQKKIRKKNEKLMKVYMFFMMVEN